MDTFQCPAITILLLVLLASPVARAGDLPRAKAHFSRAETLYRLGKFSQALSQYQASYRHAQLPRLLFNMAQCHRHLGQPKKALFYYKLFRDDWMRRFPGTRPPNDAEVKERIQQLERALSSSTESTSLPAPASRPAPGPASRPAPGPASRPAPTSNLRPPASGHKPPASGLVEPAPPPPTTSRLRRPWAWVAAGAGVAALGVGIGLLATRRVDELVWHSDGPPTRETDSGVPGAVLVGAGAAAGALSFYLFMRGEAPVRVALGLSGRGVVANLSGRF